MPAYPAGRLPVVIQIAPGAAPAADPGTYRWVEITDDWRVTHSPVTIEEGRGDWGKAVDPATCTLTLDNRTNGGRYSEFNPYGEWYGVLGPDTPLRVRLRRGEDLFARTVVDGWGTAPSGQVWTRVGGAEDDYSVQPGAGRHRLTEDAAPRLSLLAVSLLDVDVSTVVTVPAAATDAAIVPGLVARYLAGAGYLAELVIDDIGTVTLYLAVVDGVGGYTVVDFADVPDVTHTPGARYGIRLVIDGDLIAGRAWDADAGDEPTGWLAAGTDTTLTGPGQIGVRSLLDPGNSNAPLTLSYERVVVDVDMFGGTVPAWPPTWDKSGLDRTVTVTARGVLYRYKPGSGTPPVHGPFRRTTLGAGPVAYWPCELLGELDQAPASGLTVAAGLTASALPGHPPIGIAGGVQWAQVQQPVAGVTRLTDLSAGARLVAELPAAATAACTTAGEYAVQFASQHELASLSGDLVLMEWQTPGSTIAAWRLVVTQFPTGYQLVGFPAAGGSTVVIDKPGGVTTSYDIHRVTLRQVGGDIEAAFYDNGDSGTPDTGTIAGTLAGPTRMIANPTGTTDGTSPIVVGHLSVFPTADVPMRISVHADQWGEPQGAAVHSWVREAATNRARRLAAEDGVRIHVLAGDPAGEVRMGAQTPMASRPLLAEVEASDGGVLYERPHRLAYQSRTARYNQPPALTLSMAGDLSEPPEPDPHNQGYRNRWHVTRTDGGDAVAEADEVAAGALVYDDRAEVSVYDATTLPDHAWWRLHLTGRRQLRWPALVIDLAARPQLIDAWLCCRVGSRILATDPPADVAGQPIDVLIEGAKTVLGHKDFTVTATVSPARPWDVAVAGGPQRPPADGSTLAADLADDGMQLQLASTDRNGPWSTDPADMPLDIHVGGEEMRVSAITGATSPQTVTIDQRGLNGVVRAWPSGTPVQVARPAIVPM
ncbi:hypothetical protein ACN27G_05975 [Plantactinospora sp. WMMB334]|uniref:hypothetical protein n=1 Tax=Plantactinospora sp. WMMB334 TaxID=3404119 RepID=UPI003B963968